SFPQSTENCEREKTRGNRLFRNINCRTPGLCGQTDLNPEVRALICFKLPCPIFEGTQNPGTCNGLMDVYTSEISFPQPLRIERIRLTPTRVDVNGGQANLCFRIEELRVNLGLRLGLDTRNTRLP